MQDLYHQPQYYIDRIGSHKDTAPASLKQVMGAGVCRIASPYNTQCLKRAGGVKAKGVGLGCRA